MLHVIDRSYFRFFILVLALVILLLVSATLRPGAQASPDDPPPLVEGVVTDVVTLVKTTQTSQLDPPSPDPSGLTYLTDSRSLLMVDSEVNELPLFTGSNMFEITLGGELLDTFTSLPYSDEPTGVTRNPADNHLFVSDDRGTRGYHEVDPGADGLLNTTDDIVSFVNSELFGAMDPEGITIDTNEGHLFIADGGDGQGTQRIFEVDPGPNGVFDGVSPDGDDIVTSFDALALGVRDPEGIAYNPDNDHLYILSGRDALIAETDTDGVLLRYLDLSGLDEVNLSGLAYAPASEDPTTRHLYVVDGGLDDEVDPDENDGVLFELGFALNVDNLPPYVNAGPDQAIYLGEELTLAGEVDDDGNPDPPAALAVNWSQVAGPGTADFDDASVATTTVTFSEPGVHQLRLTAGDGELSASDDVTVLVRPLGILYLPAIFYMSGGAN